LFDLAEVGERVGYPMFMKPYDGGAWANVTRIENEWALKTAYDQSGTRVMHLQHGVEPYEAFVRCIALGPQTRCVKYDPAAPLHSRYTMERDFISSEDEALLRDMTLTINTFFGWDFNSCEALLKDGVWHPIDFANPCPDSQVTSLHYHFPWLIMANLRWSLFCAATRRPMRVNMDWAPYNEIAKQDRPFRDKLSAYARIARERLDADRFEEFCQRHLSHLDQVAWEFFATDQAMEAVRQKVAALYPTHEIEVFTTLFWNRIQHWREQHPPGNAGGEMRPQPLRPPAAVENPGGPSHDASGRRAAKPAAKAATVRKPPVAKSAAPGRKSAAAKAASPTKRAAGGAARPSGEPVRDQS
jgi:hypothetical protein